MAIIYSYPQVKPKTSDLLIGTVTYDGTGTYPVESNPTRTFSVQDIANLAASYTLTTQQNGTTSTLTLKSDAGSLSVVNLFRGNGISLNSNGSNTITIGNLGVLSANAANTNFINMTPSSAATGNVTFSASLSASGSAGSSTYLRGDNTWSTPVTTVSAASSTFIDLTPLSASNGNVQIGAALSASGTPTSLNFLRGDNQWAVPAGGGTVTSVNAGTGISVNNTDPDNPIINNTGVLSNIAGTGISISGATGNSTITNTAPDQTVVITGSGDTTVTGTYPTFNISSDSGVTQIVAGNDISISPVGGTGIVTINSTSQGGVTSLIAGDNITLSPVSGLGDVTVNAPGLIPYTETSTVNIQFVSEDVALGGGASSDTILSSQLAIKTYVDNAVVGGLIYQGAYDASTNTPVLDSRGTQIAVTQGWTYTVTVDGTFYGETVKVGDVLIAETNLAAGTGALTDWTTVQSNIDLATAGTSVTAIRGLAGFDSNDFTVTGGFVEIINKGYVPYTGATQNVDLGTRTLTSGDLTVNHASGSGTAVTINKGGNGAGLLINKTSGSGDALSVTGSANISNSITASSFVKPGGTSAQFLKADGSIDSNTYLTTAIDGSGTANYIPKWTDGDTIGNSVIYDNGTNVGIGTATPSVELEIASTTPQIRLNDTDGFTSTFTQSNRSLILATDTATGQILFNTDANTERMRITSSGNVGIGVEPSQKLHLYEAGSTSIYSRIQNGNNSLYLGLESGGIAQVSSDLSSLKIMANTYTSFETAGSERMRITSAGAIHLSQGTGNAYVGTNAGNLGTSTGSYNSAFGEGVLASNTTGNYNTANGVDSLYSNTTAGNNTAAGYKTLYFNTTGIGNVANGFLALYNNTEGRDNVANGAYALFENTTGDFNTANGVEALYENTTGIRNIAIGYNSGNALTTGSNNTIIGSVAGTAGLSDTVIIAAGTTERMRIDSSGNVGIGTTSPSAKMTVAGDISLYNSVASGSETNNILFKNSIYEIAQIKAIVGAGQLNRGELAFNVDNGGGMGTAMYIDRTRNVGIGTSSPSAKLHTYKTGTSDNVLKIQNGQDFYASQLNLTANNDGGAAYNSINSNTNGGSQHWNIWGAGAVNTLAIRTGGSERMRIDSSGNVGIGRSSISQPSAGATTLAIQGTTTTHAGAIRFHSSNDSVQSYMFTDSANGFSINTITSHPLVFRTVGSERMRITSGGYLKASNTGSYRDATGAYHELISNQNDVSLFILNSNSIPYGTRMEFPTDPNNTVSYFLRATGNGLSRIIIYSNGNVINSNNSYGAISDIKLKENIENASPKLNDLMQVKVRNYNLIGEETKQLGVVAQELEQVFPSMVSESPDIEEQEVTDAEGNVTTEKVDLGTTTKSVKYSVFVPMLIKAMQEQQEIINDLKSRIETLENN